MFYLLSILSSSFLLCKMQILAPFHFLISFHLLVFIEMDLFFFIFKACVYLCAFKFSLLCLCSFWSNFLEFDYLISIYKN